MRGVSVPAMVLAIDLVLAAGWPGAARAAEDREGVSEALAIYQQRLIQTGSRLDAYPEEAVRQELTGSVQIEIEIDESGRLVRQTLVKTSGHEILDRHALAMLERAVPRTPLPFALERTAFRLLVTVAFAMPPPFRIPFPPTSLERLRGAAA